MDIDEQNDPIGQTEVLAEQTKDPYLTILLTGRIAASRSNVINSPLNTEGAPVDNSKQSNIKIVRHSCVINGIPCQIIDTSCLRAILREPALSQAYIEEIRAKINTIHCIWFATWLDETGVSRDEQNAIKWITTIFGEQAWNYALLIFTQTNTAKNSWKCATMMKKQSENFRTEISKYTGWDIASGITSVPVTNLDEIMRDEQNWLPETYTQILRRADQRGIARHFLTAVKDPPSSIRLARESGSQWGEMVRDDDENKLTRGFLCGMDTLAHCYIWSAPAGAIGMCIWGPEGFGIALAGNAVFWIVLRWLQSLRKS
jgi:hypothetical protein